MNENRNQPLWSGWIKKLIFLSIGLIILSLIAPILITQIKSCIEFNAETGVIGDTIGGIVNPFIALAGVIVTGLAFYMQLKANEIQINNFQIELQNQKETFEKQLEIQKEDNRFNQFESQFYEMLRLHKENVNEIELDLYNQVENTVYDTSRGGGHLLGRRTSSIEEFTNIKSVRGRDVFIYFANELEFAFKLYKDIIGTELQFFNFSIPYKTFFNGATTLSSTDYQRRVIIEKDNFKNLVLNSTSNDNFLGITAKARYPIFEGHENKLGHYYRHLYHTVKFVALENDFLSYPQKRKYLRILRAQLSNYEQAMLFYNYLAYAPEWENNNKFLSDYRMIHNLSLETLIQDDYFLSKYQEIKNLQNTVMSYKDNDFIFESQKWDF